MLRVSPTHPHILSLALPCIRINEDSGLADSPLSDSSADGNHLNIFLEYVPGGSVAALLNNYGAFEEALVRNFVRQILTGLNYLHEREIVHRDIKGANILVDNKGGIKISDFGISKKVENSEFELRWFSFSHHGVEEAAKDRMPRIEDDWGCAAERP